MFSRFVKRVSQPRKPRRRFAVREHGVERLEHRALLSSVTVEVTATQDGTLFEDADGRQANGAGIYFLAGPSPRGNRRGLVEFDVAGAVPEGAVITDVVLTLHNSGGIRKNRKVTLHQVQTDWGTGNSDAAGNEFVGAPPGNGDATWLHTFYSGQQWDNPGGDFRRGSSGSTIVRLPGFYEWSADRMVEDVQQWLDEPATNHGWMVRSNENARSVKRFTSSEHRNPNRRPRLTITYEVPSDPGVIEGRKWNDLDVDGVRDLDEPWLDGWSIQLYDQATGDLVESTVTSSIDLDGDGSIDPETEIGWYSFNVTPGTYRIHESLEADWSQSFPTFAANIDGEDGANLTTGGMSFADGELFFDFQVNTNESHSIAFFVPEPGGGIRPIESNLFFDAGSDGTHQYGTVPLNAEEIVHLFNGELIVGLTGSTGEVLAHRPIFGAGYHVVTLDSNNVISDRNFGNHFIDSTLQTDDEVLSSPLLPGFGFLFNPEAELVVVVHDTTLLTPPTVNSDGELETFLNESTAEHVVKLLFDSTELSPELTSSLASLFGDPLALFG